MAKKILVVDPSIVNFKGHFLEYSSRIINAARRDGWEGTLFVNKGFVAQNVDHGFKIVPWFTGSFNYNLESLWIFRSLFALKKRVGRWRWSRRIRWETSYYGYLRTLDKASLLKLNPPVPFADRLVWLSFKTFHKVKLFLRRPFDLVRHLLFSAYRAYLVKRFGKDRLSPPKFEYKQHKSKIGYFGYENYRVKLRRPKPYRLKEIFNGVYAINYFIYLSEQKRRTTFAREFRSLLKSNLSPGVFVLVPTASFIEIDALIKFQKQHPLPKGTTVAFVLHHALFPSGMNAQMARSFRHDLVPTFDYLKSHQDGSIRIFCDTDELTEQVKILSGAELAKSLPIPVDSKFVEKAKAIARRKDFSEVVVGYAGDARPQKGYQLLPEIFSDLMSKLGKDSTPKFRLQSNYNYPRGAPSIRVAKSRLKSLGSDQIEMIDRPLNPDEYRNLVASTDIMPLLYDKGVYFSGSSGVFAEAMACGSLPVVSDQTWMHRCLNEVSYSLFASHGESLLTPRPLTPLSSDGKRHVVAVPEGATGILLRWQKNSDSFFAFSKFVIAEKISHGGVPVRQTQHSYFDSSREMPFILYPISPGVVELQIDMSEDNLIELGEAPYNLKIFATEAGSEAFQVFNFGVACDTEEIKPGQDIVKLLQDRQDNTSFRAPQAQALWAAVHSPEMLYQRIISEWSQVPTYLPKFGDL